MSSFLPPWRSGGRGKASLGACPGGLGRRSQGTKILPWQPADLQAWAEDPIDLTFQLGPTTGHFYWGPTGSLVSIESGAGVCYFCPRYIPTPPTGVARCFESFL